MLQALYSPFVAVTMVTPEVMVIFPHWLLHPYSLPGLALPQISYGWRLRYGAQPQWIFGLLLNLVRGASSVERLSNKKICIPFEMRVTRTVQTECRELALCRGAARSRTNFVQSYELSMEIGHGGCFF